MVTDKGGGEVQYKGYSDNILNEYSWRDYSNFTTKKTFNPANDQFYWEFYVFVNYGEKLNGISMEMAEFNYRGEIYVMTPDSQAHTIANWEKKRSGRSDFLNPDYYAVSYSITDSTWGYIYVSNISDRNYITIQYMPSSKAAEDGVICIMMKENIAHSTSSSWADYGWVQYGKSINCSALKEDSPMPSLMPLPKVAISSSPPSLTIPTSATSPAPNASPSTASPRRSAPPNNPPLISPALTLPLFVHFPQFYAGYRPFRLKS